MANMKSKLKNFMAAADRGMKRGTDQKRAEDQQLCLRPELHFQVE